MNSRNGSNDFLQSFPALNNALAGQVTPVIPEQIEEDIRDRSSWTLLPFLKQLEARDPANRFSAFTYIANDKIRRLVGTVKNVASRELLYAASSDNETFDERTTRLATYKNIVTGIMEESEKFACATEASATEPIL